MDKNKAKEDKESQKIKFFRYLIDKAYDNFNEREERLKSSYMKHKNQQIDKIDEEM